MTNVIRFFFLLISLRVSRKGNQEVNIKINNNIRLYLKALRKVIKKGNVEIKYGNVA